MQTTTSDDANHYAGKHEPSSDWVANDGDRQNPHHKKKSDPAFDGDFVNSDSWMFLHIHSFRSKAQKDSRLK